jgi:hypothetical protein
MKNLHFETKAMPDQTANERQEDGELGLPRPWLLRYAAWIVLTVAIFAVGSYSAAFYELPINENPGSWGTFGDFVGGLLNPLVSIFTLLVALQVWQLQRDELRLTRAELSKQSEASDAQRKEQRFFDCMAMYQRIVDSQTSSSTIGVQPTAHAVKYSGKDALRLRAKSALQTGEVQALTSAALTRSFNVEGHREPTPSIQDVRAALPRRKLVRLGVPQSDAYCRGVLSTLKICTDVLGTSQGNYIPLFKAQLSEEELCLLALYLLLNPDGDQYVEIASKSELFVNLDTEGIAALAREHLPPGCFANASKGA